MYPVGIDEWDYAGYAGRTEFAEIEPNRNIENHMSIYWQQHYEYGATAVVRATKGLPTQFLGQALDDRKTQSGVPAAFRADGRLKQLGAHMIGQAWTVIGDGHFHVLTPVQVDPILDGYGNRSTWPQRFGGIADQVEQYLPDDVAAAATPEEHPPDSASG
ncbi:MAG: hypothetical protein R3F40_08425 [Candidatus Competibacteraceae bacterium]